MWKFDLIGSLFSSFNRIRRIHKIDNKKLIPTIVSDLYIDSSAVFRLEWNSVCIQPAISNSTDVRTFVPSSCVYDKLPFMIPRYGARWRNCQFRMAYSRYTLIAENFLRVFVDIYSLASGLRWNVSCCSQVLMLFIIITDVDPFSVNFVDVSILLKLGRDWRLLPLVRELEALRRLKSRQQFPDHDLDLWITDFSLGFIAGKTERYGSIQIW